MVWPGEPVWWTLLLTPSSSALLPRVPRPLGCRPPFPVGDGEEGVLGRACSLWGLGAVWPLRGHTSLLQFLFLVLSFAFSRSSCQPGQHLAQRSMAQPQSQASQLSRRRLNKIV